MPPRLRISAGPDAHRLERLAVNDDKHFTIIDTEQFQGRITVRVKDFVGDEDDSLDRTSSATYFNHPYGSLMTYSIQVQGRFLDSVNCDDLLFGNAFDGPIRDNLPYGTSLALRFLPAIDPNLKHDLYADQPWAFSPLLATMYRVQAHRLFEADLGTGKSAQDCFEHEDWPTFPTGKSETDYIHDDITPLFYNLNDNKHQALNTDMEENEDVVQKMNEESSPQAPRHRASWIGYAKNRKTISLTEKDVLTFDFCNGYVRETNLF